LSFQLPSHPQNHGQPCVEFFLYLTPDSTEKRGVMIPSGNLLLWVAVLGASFLVFNAVAAALGRATDGRVRRKCKRNHGRVAHRRSGRPLVTLSAKTAKA
jgi:hypothetical protein